MGSSTAMRRHGGRGALLAAALATGTPAPAAESWSVGGLRFTLGGELDAAGSVGETGYFNDGEYRNSELERLRLRLLGSLELGEHAALLAELRSEDLAEPRLYALFLRVRPFVEKPIDAQAGLIPPVFGAFARRSYAWDNPLISTPLPYGYRTALRSDAVAMRWGDMWRTRGWGPRVVLPDTAPAAGIPLVEAGRWDTGVQLRLGERPVQLALALTRGSPSRPLTHDDNDGHQLAGRLALRPHAGLEIGLSAARGAYLERGALEAAGAAAGSDSQTALGMDLEWSRGYWLVRGELIWSRWQTPLAPEDPLEAWGVTAEARYKILPGLFAAARFDHLGFDEVVAAERGRFSWDAPVSRLEAGLGWSPLRHLMLKGVYQRNWRTAGPVTLDQVGALQAVLWY